MLLQGQRKRKASCSTFRYPHSFSFLYYTPDLYGTSKIDVNMNIKTTLYMQSNMLLNMDNHMEHWMDLIILEVSVDLICPGLLLQVLQPQAAPAAPQSGADTALGQAGNASSQPQQQQRPGSLHRPAQPLATIAAVTQQWLGAPTQAPAPGGARPGLASLIGPAAARLPAASAPFQLVRAVAQSVTVGSKFIVDPSVEPECPSHSKEHASDAGVT